MVGLSKAALILPTTKTSLGLETPRIVPINAHYGRVIGRNEIHF